MAGLTIFQTYAMIFMTICSIVATVIGFKYQNKVPEFRLLYLYPFASLIQIVIYYIIFFNGIVSADLIHNNLVVVNMFVLFESSIIYYFFWNVLKLKQVKIKLILAAIIYISFLFVYWVREKGFFNGSYTFLIESALILALCSSYFFEKFKKPLAPNLAHEPSFWIVIGLGFYFCSTFPMFLLQQDLFYEAGLIKKQEVYAMSLIFYGVMFLLITIAYLCKQNKA